MFTKVLSLTWGTTPEILIEIARRVARAVASRGILGPTSLVASEIAGRVASEVALRVAQPAISRATSAVAAEVTLQ